MTITGDGGFAGVSAADLRPPIALRGMRIGLFGGSFNPAHRGHAHVALTGLTRLRLDRVWVMVTPGNPLKDAGHLAPLAARIASCRALIDHPRVDVRAFEAHWHIRYSWQTVRRLKAAFPGVDFVWLMGADNLASFHRWQHWRRIAAAMPIAVIDRPGATLSVSSSRAAIALENAWLQETCAKSLPTRPAPAWTFIHAPRVPLSSTELRRGQKNDGR